MTNPVPRWIMLRYALLWSRFKDKSFNHEQAVKTLRDKHEVVSVFLSELKKNDWVEVTLNPRDTRMRLYKLKEPNQAVLEMIR